MNDVTFGSIVVLLQIQHRTKWTRSLNFEARHDLSSEIIIKNQLKREKNIDGLWRAVVDSKFYFQADSSLYHN